MKSLLTVLMFLLLLFGCTKELQTKPKKVSVVPQFGGTWYIDETICLFLEEPENGEIYTGFQKSYCLEGKIVVEEVTVFIKAENNRIIVTTFLHPRTKQQRTVLATLFFIGKVVPNSKGEKMTFDYGNTVTRVFDGHTMRIIERPLLKSTWQKLNTAEELQKCVITRHKI